MKDTKTTLELLTLKFKLLSQSLLPSKKLINPCFLVNKTDLFINKLKEFINKINLLRINNIASVGKGILK